MLLLPPSKVFLLFMLGILASANLIVGNIYCCLLRSDDVLLVQLLTACAL